MNSRKKGKTNSQR